MRLSIIAPRAHVFMICAASVCVCVCVQNLFCKFSVSDELAAVWWDVVVGVNAAEHGKMPRGALSRYDTVVCVGINGE